MEGATISEVIKLRGVMEVTYYHYSTPKEVQVNQVGYRGVNRAAGAEAMTSEQG